ncbi:FecR family protein [Xylophilus rhododendri]|uniref:FecR family protein n=1 Tax=Xylophilus rhododendri TaxID=2697032 RepID=UPI001E2FE361|nr:FecR domain-containing protein [Xylophilus rhododendri]
MAQQARSEADRLAEQAADWLVRLGGDDPAERARCRQGFARWKAADPRHAQAAERIESFIERVQGVGQASDGNTRPARAALDAALGSRSRQRARRQRVGALLVVLAMAFTASLALTGGSPGDLLADLRSGETDWVGRTLPDGSRITLSGRAAIDLHFDAASRTIRLRHGDIRIEVAHDAARPFYVETPLARIRALGTRFAVSHEQDRTRVEMFESKVSVQALASPEAATVVHAGERLLLTRQGLSAIEHLDAARIEQGWQRHQLVLNDRPLPEVLAQLSRHRPGGIRYDAAALQGLRVSAVLPLDRPDEALQLLLASFPELRLRTLAGRWAWVELAEAQAQK